MTKNRIEKIVYKFFEQCNPYYWNENLNERSVTFKKWNQDLTMGVQIQLQIQERADHSGYCMIHFIDIVENKVFAQSVCTQTNSALLLTDTIWKLVQENKEKFRPKYVLMYSSNVDVLEKIGIKYGYSFFNNKIVPMTNPVSSNVDLVQIKQDELPQHIILSNSTGDYMIHNPEQVYVRGETVTILTKDHSYLLQDFDSMFCDKILV